MSSKGRSALHRLGSAILFICLLLALLHAMYFEIEPAAPLRQILAGTSPQLNIEKQVARASEMFTNAANGGNLSLHFSGFQANDPQLAHLIAQFYFLAAYDLFPKQAIVGTGDRIINSASDLPAIDIVPSDDWLKIHDVNALINVHRNADGSLAIDTRNLH